jgi:hypothetical protein
MLNRKAVKAKNPKYPASKVTSLLRDEVSRDSA